MKEKKNILTWAVAALFSLCCSLSLFRVKNMSCLS